MIISASPLPMNGDHTLNIRPPAWLPIAVALIVGGLYVAGKFVETRDMIEPTISVTGEGRVFVVPDIAEVSLGIQTGRQPSAAEAMRRLREGMSAVFAAVKKAGVEEKDIRTENFTLNPVYDWTEKGQIFRGFEANQSLRVKVRNLDKVTDVITAAAGAGANQAGNVAFTVDDPERVRAEARDDAIAQAKAKAQKLASDLGMRLGEIEGFNEGGYGGPPVVFMRSAEMGMAGGGGDVPLPVPAGEQEIVVQVTITYELE